MNFNNDMFEMTNNWETDVVVPFCFPISLCRGKFEYKEDLIKTIKSSETKQLSKKDNGVSNLSSRIIKNFLQINEKYYQYDLSQLSPYVTSLWYNIYKKGENITSHVHPNSWFSGVYYPHGTGKTEILFENPINYVTIEPPRKNFNQYNSSTWSFEFPEDTMIFFPSYLRHQTFFHQGEEERISIAFNIFLKGVVSEQAETYLLL